MRRIALWLASTISALFLLFSYHTSTNAAATTSIVAPQTDAAAVAGAAGTPSTTSGSPTSGSSTTSGSTTSGSTTSGSVMSGAATSGASAAANGAAATAAATTVDGSVISTRYGNVQVQITVADGKVTAAKVLQVPWSDRKDQQINSRAVPILNSEAVAAQSSDIDMVSGATYTSQAYAQSLQAALDAAHV
jgi:uncharacterized protein with FMN-binding domain